MIKFIQPELTTPLINLEEEQRQFWKAKTLKQEKKKGMIAAMPILKRSEIEMSSPRVEEETKNVDYETNSKPLLKRQVQALPEGNLKVNHHQSLAWL